MKTKLLKKVRKRFKLVKAFGTYYLLDLKEQQTVAISTKREAPDIKRLHKLLVADAMRLTLGSDRYTTLLQERHDRRKEKRQREQYLAIINNIV